MELRDLKDKVGWVLFLFPDGSKRVLRTTLSSQLLAPFLHSKGDNDLYDIDKQKWIKVPKFDSYEVSVTEEKPELKGIDQFVNQFI